MEGKVAAGPSGRDTSGESHRHGRRQRRRGGGGGSGDSFKVSGCGGAHDESPLMGACQAGLAMYAQGGSSSSPFPSKSSVICLLHVYTRGMAWLSSPPRYWLYLSVITTLIIMASQPWHHWSPP